LLIERLNRCADILDISASTITGNVLVYFSPDHGSAGILALIDTALRNGAVAQDPGSRQIGLSAAPTDATATFPETWHRMASDLVLKRCGTDRKGGLTHTEALGRLHASGPNVLETLKTRRRKDIFVGQLLSLPSLLLSASAAVSLITGAWLEAAILLTVTLSNAVFGYFLEHRAEACIAGLKHNTAPTVQVIRNGNPTEVPGETLVIGDMLLLRPGTYIGADSRIIEAVNLKIDESILTGESEPVQKTSEMLTKVDMPVTGRLNMAFMGTLVIGGEGLAVVVATGRHTEFGRIHMLVQETLPPTTPQVIRLRQLSSQLLKAGVLVCGVTLGLSVIRGFGILRALGLSLSMAASAIPAGLPSVANLSLALNLIRLKKNHLAIQRLYAFETLGEVSLICFDKTGTLTRSRISVLEIYTGSVPVSVFNRRLVAGGKPIDPETFVELQQLIRLCILCNENKIEFPPGGGKFVLHGSPTEKALLSLGIVSGADVHKIYDTYRLDSVQHRSEQARYMVTVHTIPGNGRLVSVKGNPSEVLSLCKWRMIDGGISQLCPADVSEIEIQNERMASKALRVLGFAYKALSDADLSAEAENLVWVGLVGMMEPIRMGVPEMIAALHSAGIETAMITGDQSLTAYAVAERIDIAGGRAPKLLDSSSVSRMKPEVMQALVKDVHVFSRVNPEQKLQIVRAYQETGRIVAMTGDGINDGPALRAADIGIAMGLSGTEVARETSDIILEQDNITALESAVKESRTAGDNIKRSIRYLLTVNFSDVLVSLGALLWPGGTTLIQHQPTRINIFLDIVPSLALLNAPPDEEVMTRGPRDRTQAFFSRADISGMIADAALISAGALGGFAYGMSRYGFSSRAATIGWESLAVGKLLHAVNMSFRNSNMKSPEIQTNFMMPRALGLAVAVQALPFFVPGLRRLLGLAELKLADFLALGISAFLPFWVRRLKERLPYSLSTRQPASLGPPFRKVKKP
jgi:Ca2+-transporting ATPase